MIEEYDINQEVFVYGPKERSTSNSYVSIANIAIVISVVRNECNPSPVMGITAL